MVGFHSQALEVRTDCAERKRKANKGADTIDSEEVVRLRILVERDESFPGRWWWRADVRGSQPSGTGAASCTFEGFPEGVSGSAGRWERRRRGSVAVALMVVIVAVIVIFIVRVKVIVVDEISATTTIFLLSFPQYTQSVVGRLSLRLPLRPPFLCVPVHVQVPLSVSVGCAVLCCAVLCCAASSCHDLEVVSLKRQPLWT